MILSDRATREGRFIIRALAASFLPSARSRYSRQCTRDKPFDNSLPTRSKMRQVYGGIATRRNLTSVFKFGLLSARNAWKISLQFRSLITFCTRQVTFSILPQTLLHFLIDSISPRACNRKSRQRPHSNLSYTERRSSSHQHKVCSQRTNLPSPRKRSGRRREFLME